MSDSEALAPPTMPQIERAIDEVVSLIVDYRRRQPDAVQRAVQARDDEPIDGITAADLIGTSPDVLRARDVTKSPVEIGLKYSLKRLGELVHQRVGDDTMIEVAERVCDLEPGNWSRRMSVINSAWDGIGAWYA